MVIKIFGGKKEGKSTIASLIEKTLKEYSIKVENTDTDSAHYTKKLEVIESACKSGDHLNVVIKTIDYKRETVPQYSKKDY